MVRIRGAAPTTTYEGDIPGLVSRVPDKAGRLFTCAVRLAGCCRCCSEANAELATLGDAVRRPCPFGLSFELFGSPFRSYDGRGAGMGGAFRSYES